MSLSGDEMDDYTVKSNFERVMTIFTVAEHIPVCVCIFAPVISLTEKPD